MSRIEKKCIVGSAALHGLLLVCFVFGSAFFAAKHKPNSGGTIRIVSLPESTTPASLPPPPKGNPDVEPPQPQPEPPQPKPPEPKPEPQPMPPEPKPQITPKVEKKPDAEKVRERGDVPVAMAKDPKDKPKQNTPTQPRLTYTAVKRTNGPVVNVAAVSAQNAQREREARAQAAAIAARNKAISEAAGVMNGVGKGLSHSTVVSSVGVDTSGGAVSGRYGDGLKAIYDARWTLNNELTDDESATSVSVVVARDGTVKSARITKRSGNPSFDRSVQSVLDKVRTVQPFPPEMKDSEREFAWRFTRKMRLG